MVKTSKKIRSKNENLHSKSGSAVVKNAAINIKQKSWEEKKKELQLAGRKCTSKVRTNFMISLRRKAKSIDARMKLIEVISRKYKAKYNQIPITRAERATERAATPIVLERCDLDWQNPVMYRLSPWTGWKMSLRRAGLKWTDDYKNQWILNRIQSLNEKRRAMELSEKDHDTSHGLESEEDEEEIGSDSSNGSAEFDRRSKEYGISRESSGVPSEVSTGSNTDQGRISANSSVDRLKEEGGKKVTQIKKDEEKKGKNRKKVNREETSDDEECKILEVKSKKKKMKMDIKKEKESPRSIVGREMNERVDWRVTGLWRQSNEWMEWEKKKKKEMEKLSSRINQFMIAVAMREEHYEKKLKIANWISKVLAKHWSVFTVQIVGSSLCTIGAHNSNLDLYIQKDKGEIYLESVEEKFLLEKSVELIEDENSRRLKGFKKSVMKINNASTEGRSVYVAIHSDPSTPYMSRVYQVVDRQDIRVTALALILKGWSFMDEECLDSNIQRYHVMNLLIHFLQCGVSPPILPSLIRFYPHIDPRQYHKNDLPEPIQTENTQSMASLLVGFFTYYFQFNFENDIISIRAGNVYQSRMFDKESTKKMKIANPYFDPNNNPDIVSNVDIARFRSSCKKSLESLTSSFNLSSLDRL